MTPVKLTELEPKWLKVLYNEHGTVTGFKEDSSLNAKTAQGIIFACPLCYQKNRSLIGTHSVVLWFADRNVPNSDELASGLARWTATGEWFYNLTLSPSIDLTKNDPDEWHGFIQNGLVT